MKTIFILLLQILFTSNIIGQVTHFTSQTELDTFTQILGGEIYIWSWDTSSDPITNLDCLKKIKFNNIRLFIFSTKIKKIDLSEVSVDYLLNLKIDNNDSLKEIKGLNKVKNSFQVWIEKNSNLETIDLAFDSVNSSCVFLINENPKLKSFDIVYNKDFLTDKFDYYYDAYRFGGHGMYIGNNPLLQKITYNKKIGTGRLSRLCVEYNKSLDSIIINKVNVNTVKWAGQDTLNSNNYRSIASKSDFNSGDAYNLGLRVTILANDSLRYLGGGFDKDTFNLVNMYVKSNPRLSNLCVFKPKILSFPNPQSNFDILYQVINNDVGANTIEEIVATDCSKKLAIINLATNQLEFNVYPNPTNGFLTLQLPNEETYHVTIMNVMGQQVFETNVSQVSPSINLPKIGKGYYMLHCKSSSVESNTKILVE